MDLKKLNNKKLRVLNRTYTLKVKKSIQGGRFLGMTNHNDNEILISRKQDIDSFADTLLHEILHCIWYTTGIAYALDAKEAEEFSVNLLASSIMAVLTDNPWVLEVINHSVKDYPKGTK